MTAAEHLADELERLALAGRAPACRHDPEAWFSTDPDERTEAAARCAPCAIRPACLAAAREADERHGVWGGRDFTQTARGARQSA